MIISSGRNYIFVHIPKTGGTSMAAALEARAHRDDILIGDTPKARRRKRRLDGLTTKGRLWKHSSLDDIEGVVDDALVQAAFVFTLVRNPWDRLVSYYHWLRRQGFDHPAVRLARAVDFDGFLGDPATQQSFRTGSAASYVTWRGQVRCDGFLRIEHLDADIAPLIRHLRFDPRPLPHLNPSLRGTDWRPYYSAETADIVGEICADDIARFGYRFDP